MANLLFKYPIQISGGVAAATYFRNKNISSSIKAGVVTFGGITLMNLLISEMGDLGLIDQKTERMFFDGRSGIYDYIDTQLDAAQSNGTFIDTKSREFYIDGTAQKNFIERAAVRNDPAKQGLFVIQPGGGSKFVPIKGGGYTS